jgi:hypothetical protein
MNITLDKKTDASITFQYYESDGTTPRTLVGATLYFTVKTSNTDTEATDASAVIKKDITSHTNAAGGLSTIVLTDTDTNITPKKYFYDIKIKEADSNIYLAQSGKITVGSNITNRAA